MFDFPNSPSVGQTATTPNGAVFTWDGTKWTSAGAMGTSISVGDTPPASVVVGSGWWDSTSGQLYIWYNDGNSSQWVPASNRAAPPVPLPVSVANGGTGSTTAGAALTALGAAPLNAPVFTGDARAVTPATADNDTSIATTAYVQAQGYATSAAMTTADNLRVLKSGDTMTGGLNITPVSGSASLTLAKSAGANLNIIQGNVAGSPRWQMYVGNNVAETGSDTGSNLDIYRFADGGSAVLALTINRATGATTVVGDLAFGSGTADHKQFGFTSGNGPILHLWGTAAAGANSITTSTTFWAATNNTLSCGLPGGAWNAVHAYAFTNASDPALKIAIEPAPPALDAVLALDPKTYLWREGVDTTRRHHGFLSTEVRDVLGEEFGGWVKDARTGEEGLNYHELTAVLWQAVRELSAKVAALEGAGK